MNASIMRYTRLFLLNSRNCTCTMGAEEEKKGNAIIITGFFSSSTRSPATAALQFTLERLRSFIERCEFASKSCTKFSRVFSKRDEQSVIGNGKFSWNISSLPSKFFPPLLPPRPRFFKKEKIAGQAGRVVGDDLDISIPETCRLVEIYFNEHEGPLCFSSSSRQEKEIRSSLVLNVFKRSRVFTGFSCWPGGIP